MQTALKWRVRPLEFLGVESGGPWTETDRLLAEALTVYERMICSDCGCNSRVACDEDMDGWFEVDDSTTCQACAARERYTKDLKDRTPDPGVKIGVRLDPEWANKDR